MYKARASGNQPITPMETKGSAREWPKRRPILIIITNLPQGLVQKPLIRAELMEELPPSTPYIYQDIWRHQQHPLEGALWKDRNTQEDFFFQSKRWMRMNPASPEAAKHLSWMSNLYFIYTVHNKLHDIKNPYMAHSGNANLTYTHPFQ